MKAQERASVQQAVTATLVEKNLKKVINEETAAVNQNLGQVSDRVATLETNQETMVNTSLPQLSEEIASLQQSAGDKLKRLARELRGSKQQSRTDLATAAADLRVSMSFVRIAMASMADCRRTSSVTGGRQWYCTKWLAGDLMPVR
jgi:hypothetical protein